MTGVIAGCVLAGFAAYSNAASPATTLAPTTIVSPAPPSSQSPAPLTESQIATLTDKAAATLNPAVPSGWSVTANLVVLLIAVAGLVAVFWMFGLSKRNEALGMPANSVRALLALIVLVMLATLGTQFFNAMSSPAVEVATFTNVKASDVEAIKGTEFVAIVLSRDPVSDLLSGKIFRPSSTAAAQDLAKNIASALLTLLTAIISFYFGTQAAREGARGVTEQQSKTNEQQVPSGGPPNVEANAAKAMADGNQGKLAELGEDPVKVLRDALAGAPNVAASLSDAFKDAQAAFEKAKNAVAASRTHAQDAAVAAADATSSSSDPDKLKDATARAQKASDAASADSHDFEQAMATFKAADEKILSATAKG
jgi:hypothetical protein